LSALWKGAHLPSSSQTQPTEQQEVIHRRDEYKDTSSGKTHSTSSRQQSGSRGSPLEAPLQDHSTRRCARSYVKAPEEASTPQVEETLVKLGRHLVNTSDNQACGKRSAGIISHSAGLGGILYLEPAWTQAGGRREREAR